MRTHTTSRRLAGRSSKIHEGGAWAFRHHGYFNMSNVRRQLRRSPARRRPIALTYHGVMDVPLRRDPHGLFVRPDDLRRHIEALRNWGYELMAFSSWASRVLAGRGEGAAALTFDDGLVDNLETLTLLLEQEAAPATAFVVSQLLGQPHAAASWTRMLTAEETRELHARGVEIGGHTRSHPDLTMLSVDDAYGELAGCRRDLEELLGTSVTVAAYPFGHANPAVVAACRRAGFSAACRCNGSGEWDNPQNLPREDVHNRMTLLELRLTRDGHYQRLVSHRSARAIRRLSLATRGAPLRKPREIRNGRHGPVPAHPRVRPSRSSR
jgi:peptidoglycan/xylan/chitin deacetylase (PgdA/CDA1 family)